MTIFINCPHCTSRLNAPDSMAGKKIKCPKCGKIGAVPFEQESPNTQWYVQLGDGSEFGPVSRTELDEWFREERITEDCQLLKEGSDQWQWATDVYPSLELPQQPVATQPQRPLMQQQQPQTRAPANDPFGGDPFQPMSSPAPLKSSSPFDDLGSSSPLAGEYGLQPAPALAPAPLAPAPASPYGASMPAGEAVPNADGETTPLQNAGYFVALLPLIFGCMEMVPGWGFVGMSMLIGIPIIMVAGLVGGAMIGGRYLVPGAIAGVVCNLGAAIALIILLQNVNVVNKVVVLVVGLIGALPGFGLFWVLKLIQDAIMPKRS